MNRMETDHIGDTVRIRRPPKVVTDERGGTVWMGRVDPCKIELDAGPATDPYDSADSIGWPTANLR